MKQNSLIVACIFLSLNSLNILAQNNINTSRTDSAAQDILGKMSLREKVNEIHGSGIIAFGLSRVFTGRITPVKAGGNKRLHIPTTAFFDGPRGMGLYKGATAFPTTMARGASWDRDLERRIGEAMAEEIRAAGGNYSGAVCMNLLRHPAWGRAQETYGEDPHHLGEMASALVAGIQKHNVQACAKHFAANSMENNRFGGSMNMSERTLQEVYLPHFKKVVQNGVASIMSAYNRLNGEYCGHNYHLLTEILRNQWGFKSYVTSDWQDGLFDAEKGIKAGMNVEMPSKKVYTLSTVKKLIRGGKITEKHIDDLVFPIIRTKLLFAAKADTQHYDKRLIGSKAHTDLAREAAEKSAVLLKNDYNLLPIPKKLIQRIAVIGSLADYAQTGDRGSSGVMAPYIITPLQGIKNYLKDTKVEVMIAEVNDTAAIKKICSNADVVIVVAGTTYLDEGEYIGMGKMRDINNPDKKGFVVKSGVLGLGGDRKYLHLHQPDIEAIKAASSVNEKVTVCLVAGSAVTVEEWHEKTAAILQTFYNGMEGGNALAKIIFGEVNPSGKLPFTVPKLESDLPPFNSFDKEVDYGYYHGYSLFDKKKIEARYPFGFGLSYTRFHIFDLKIGAKELTEKDTIEVSIKVKNKTKTAGAEVVQFYIGIPNASIDRPVKILRAFEKIFLSAKEEKTIKLKVPVSDLAYYNTATNKWEIELMKYNILIGNSSQSTEMLTDTIVIK